ncbi:helix-turn-helix transcriptional regulator [Streptomyces sp. ET3-23]|uniref:winged helix-turn-helix transcriptional regulator n=1 Tax=Streptomyces sp. ET3-23 TaxID=2885643 RepID=UPI001D10F8D9|nr:helix-turn-helix domain-containing protein [Streptomyces sp. ET3-23]MCC2274531.1 helix-turn-helix transcriptional regulator [Streptomyces sp. ET3-23]
MVAQTPAPGPDGTSGCSIERSLQVLGERWTLLILREVFAGKNKYADIREALGVAPNVLSARLKALVAAGVLETRTYQDPGCRARDAYHLTPAGRDLRLVLAAIQQWGDRHMPCPSGPYAVRRSCSTGQRVDVAFVDERGDVVQPEDVAFLGPT